MIATSPPSAWPRPPKAAPSPLFFRPRRGGARPRGRSAGWLGARTWARRPWAIWRPPSFGQGSTPRLPSSWRGRSRRRLPDGARFPLFSFGRRRRSERERGPYEIDDCKAKRGPEEGVREGNGTCPNHMERSIPLCSAAPSLGPPRERESGSVPPLPTVPQAAKQTLPVRAVMTKPHIQARNF